MKEEQVTNKSSLILSQTSDCYREKRNFQLDLSVITVILWLEYGHLKKLDKGYHENLETSFAWRTVKQISSTVVSEMDWLSGSTMIRPGATTHTYPSLH